VITLEQVRDQLTGRQFHHARAVLESSFEAFCRWVFPEIDGTDIIWEHPQREKARVLEGVTTGLYRRLIINEAPRYSKTLMTSILWPSWCLVRDPTCNFLHLSYSDSLVRDNSSMVRHVLSSPRCQYFWPNVQWKGDTTAKDYWKTTAGGMYRAVSTAGQVTGFGAGRLRSKHFAGAMIIDDPIKPDDVRSILKMETINARHNTTFKSRVNDKRTPIVVNAQRLDNSDYSGFLLGGGSGEQWHHLKLPAMVTPESRESDRYDKDWTHGVPIPMSDSIADGPLWPDKVDDAEAEMMIQSMPDVYETQFQQNPGTDSSQFFSPSWFPRWLRVNLTRGPVCKVWTTDDKSDDGIEIHDLRVIADTAMKTEKRHDYSVFQLWGRGRDKRIYLLDQVRGKWEAPELQQTADDFLDKHAMRTGRRIGWSTIHIEDKASGTGLIQTLAKKYHKRVIPIQRAKDKVSRAWDCVGDVMQGNVVIPAAAPWVPAYLEEFHLFNRRMTHAHDDQIDPTMDAIQEMLGNANDYSWV